MEGNEQALDEMSSPHSPESISITENVRAINTDALIEKLRDLIEGKGKILKTFENERRELFRKIVIWSGLCLVLITFLIIFYCQHVLNLKFDSTWTWQVGYDTAIRITIISLFVSAIVFCLKMLRSYLYLYEQMRHKIIVVRSMPELIYAVEDKNGNNEQYNVVYSKILEMILHVGNTGLISKESDISLGFNAIDLLKESLKKEK